MSITEDMEVAKLAQTSEQDHFCEVAAYLYQVRLEQGLTIIDVAQRSSLSPALIQAIECRDFRNLPGTWPIGICIQRYADALGLKGAEVSSGLSRRASAR
ncbi:helix-turn-helix domain-containing protein [Leptolyngbya sp. BL0902]|uniref:helix-turn-helix domain-containing protein n=1 Tax=Leptolyngbya sp. BL0902 TaxID=1115757 RepID=UPI0018E85D87|nr:helix-turn-helix transcriptional regulator [Leptolyngbya sp. BL0902]QQE65223.1 helix-turn-helix domain-containing protein [Leptolyngbya sp. BL0902]